SRAMGVRGIVVASLATKEQRDFLASEARQRAALHRLPPLAVLVLHGTVRRAISAPAMALLESIAGRDVAIVGDPPRLVYDPEGVETARPRRDTVHARSGPLAGQAGRWDGLAGLRRFAGGTYLEAGFVRFGDDPPIAIALGELRPDGRIRRPIAAVPHRPVPPRDGRRRAGQRPPRRAPGRWSHAHRVARPPGAGAARRTAGHPHRGCR